MFSRVKENIQKVALNEQVTLSNQGTVRAPPAYFNPERNMLARQL